MHSRKSDIFMLYLLLNIIVLAILFFHAHFPAAAVSATLQENRTVVSNLRLTDICLFTDARYTRNPSIADPNSSFQDCPMSLDHFPSGSLMPPPPHLNRHDLD
jgi:hypothetical protein